VEAGLSKPWRGDNGGMVHVLLYETSRDTVRSARLFLKKRRNSRHQCPASLSLVHLVHVADHVGTGDVIQAASEHILRKSELLDAGD
jgi:hypothetical protein